MLWRSRNAGIYAFFTKASKPKIQFRVMLARYRGYTIRPTAKVSRIRKDANYVKIAGYSISDFLYAARSAASHRILQMDAYQQEVSARLIREITTRLSYQTV